MSRIDFTSAWIVTGLAYALYFYQAISRVQFADLVRSPGRMLSIFAGFLSAMMLSDVMWMILEEGTANFLKDWTNLVLLSAALVFAVGSLLGLSFKGWTHWKSLIPAGLAGVAIYQILRRRKPLG